ncbi:MAG: hypothetical protein A2W36_05000 [Chloroflexi bacterium RBG_16_58_14]|nr:MAG: hypothetical protein A2W36_05000 [Chloroflexi bacterium RBG_16_58_14]
MQHRSEETRSHILDAAYRLFSQEGYAATGVAELCATAGVSKGAFYHHFPSKQAVFLALMEIWLERLDVAFANARQSASSVEQAVVNMAGMAGSVMSSADVHPIILLEFWMQAYREPAVWQAAITPYRRYQHYFARLVEDGIAEGSLRQVEPGLAGRVLVSLALGLLMQAVFDTQAIDLAKEASQSLEILMDGLARRAA